MDFSMVTRDLICKGCGNHYHRWVNTIFYDYGYIPVMTADRKIVKLVPTDNAAWSEVKRLQDELSREVSLCPSKYSDFFDMLLMATLDEPRPGDHWYIWGRTPCPACGCMERFSERDAERPEYWNMQIDYATQDRWGSLTVRQREVIAWRILDQFKDKWGWRNPQTGKRFGD